MTTVYSDNLMKLDAPAKGVKGNRLGSILITGGKLTAADAERVLELQKREGWRFGEAALRLSLISERDLNQALYKQYDLPWLLPGQGHFSRELITAHQPSHPRTEELRALRTQLLIRWFRQPAVEQQTLAVVSPGEGEGRSYVAANLAVLFCQLGERTLLVDADLRHPRQHEIFKISDRVGLAAVLAGRAEANCAVPVPGFHDLFVLPAGAPPPNPLELLSRPALPSLLKLVAAEFDVVIIDTPPALPFSDAQAIGFRAGSAMVLARMNHTRLADTDRVVRDLSDSGTRVVGTVINSF